jgi:hypothetical protein
MVGSGDFDFVEWCEGELARLREELAAVRKGGGINWPERVARLRQKIEDLEAALEEHRRSRG